MKTSFYLALWLILQFISLQIDSYFINLYVARAFIEIDVVIVLILYWIINHTSSSQQYCWYETKLRGLKNSGQEQQGNNVHSKNSLRLSYFFNTLVITAFCISAIFIAWTLYHVRVSDWWGRVDWICLIIYVIFTCRIVSKSIDNIYNLRKSYLPHTIDSSHKEEYINRVSNHIPQKFVFYQSLNMVSSIISFILGVIIFSAAIYLFLTHFEKRAIGVACIFYMYGSLATYFGIKDIIATTQNFKTYKSLSTEEK